MGMRYLKDLHPKFGDYKHKKNDEKDCKKKHHHKDRRHPKKW